MGRGLSKLQRWILRRGATGHTLFQVEILAEFFGWEPKYELERFGEGRYEADTRHPKGMLAMGVCRNFFSPREIGEKRYRKTRAALSRSCSRLEQRGLVRLIRFAYHLGWGIEVTPKGQQWVHEQDWLSVNRVS
jgi:hypothetical protein